MAEEEQTLTPRRFLEEWPLYRTADFQGQWSTPDSISRDCEICDQKGTTWARLGIPDIPVGSLYFYGYRCKLCEQTRVYFLVHSAEHGRQKVGQIPAPSISIPLYIRKGLESDADLYRKALICRNQGYGLAAVAYFRRVVENKTNDLIDIMADLGAAQGLPGGEVDKIRAAKDQKKYEDKLEVAAGLIPSSLRPGNVNPLGVLHDRYSEGLHGRSEDECLQIADDLQEVFERVFGTLRFQAQEQRRFVEKVTKIAGRQKGNP